MAQTSILPSRMRVRVRRSGRTAAAVFARYRNNPAYLALLLGAFSLFSALMLSSGHMATEDAIALRQKEDLQKSLAMVIPNALHDNDLVKDAFDLKAKDGSVRRIYPAYAAGAIQAVAYQVSEIGYAGPILVLLGVDRNGSLLGVRVLQHAETPGLGDKIEASRGDWIFQFTGLSLRNPTPDQWAVKKDGGYFDQLSGATITPRAVVQSVRDGLTYFDNNKAALLGGSVPAVASGEKQ